MMASTTFPPLEDNAFAGSDFNDLAQAGGLEAVLDAVHAAVPPDQLNDGAQAAAPAPAAASTDDWPAPILPGQLQTPPITADVLPSWCADMAGAIATSTQTAPGMAVMMVLAALGTVLQRRFEVAPFDDDYTEPLALWTLTAAPSASRKSAVMSAVLAPLVHWEKLQRDRMAREIAKVNALRAVGEKRIERLRQDAAKAGSDKERADITAQIEQEELNLPEEVRAPRLFVGDVTLERLQNLLVDHGERMAVLSDEPGIFLILSGLYTGGAANFDVALQGHAGTPLRVDRSGRSAYCDKPALSFGLLLQPGVMAETAKSRRFRDSGLLARFLFCMPPSNVGRRDVRARQTIPAHVRETYERNLFALLEGHGDKLTKPKRLGFDPEAREMWLDFAQAIEDGMAEGGTFSSMADWCGKLPGAVARIAALMELAEVGLQAERVRLATMAKAIDLAWLLIDHAKAAFALLGADEIDADAAAVLAWVRGERRPEFSRRDAQKAMEGRFRTVERLAKALERLESMEVLRGFLHRPTKGRASQRYQVNPAILSTT